MNFDKKLCLSWAADKKDKRKRFSTQIRHVIIHAIGKHYKDEFLKTVLFMTLLPFIGWSN